MTVTGDSAAQTLVFDSSTLILFLNDALPVETVELFKRHLQTGQAFISAIVRAEFWRGTAIQWPHWRRLARSWIFVGSCR